MSDWISVKDKLPPDSMEVDTVISDEKGLRNEQSLKFHRNLWWFPDMSMYVYYSPTHWKPK